MRIAADWVWTGLPAVAPQPATLVIERGRIVSVEPFTRHADTVFEEAVVFPGLVNAHTHLDLSFAPDTPHLEGSFWQWLLGVRDRRRTVGLNGLEQAARAGVAGALACGTTLVLDNDLVGVSRTALAESSLRHVLFQEVIAFDEQAPLPPLDAWLALPADAQRLLGVAPHAPYTVHPERLMTLVRQTRAAGRPWSMHFAEQPWEHEFLAAGTGPLSEFFARLGVEVRPFVGQSDVIHRLRRAGLLGHGAFLVHGNYLLQDEIEAIAAGGAAVVYCPRSHAWFRHEPHPLPRLLAAGVAVCIGTDGMISSGDLSLLDELRMAWQRFPELAPECLLDCATRVPRRHLGGHFGQGTLSIGEPADLCVVGVQARRAHEVLPALLGGNGSILASFVGGVASPAGAS